MTASISEGAQHDAAHEAADVVVADGVRLRRRGEPARDGHLAREQEPDHPGRDHDPEAADLDQQHDHDLTERAPVRRRVDDGEPCHAYGGCRGEERIEEVGDLA